MKFRGVLARLQCLQAFLNVPTFLDARAAVAMTSPERLKVRVKVISSPLLVRSEALFGDWE